MLKVWGRLRSGKEFLTPVNFKELFIKGGSGVDRRG
jgi:hypothetical protein